MQCPRCQLELEERDREGVVIDVCRSCRGVWLDRGELEKLIARAASEVQALESEYRAPRRDSGEYDGERAYRRDTNDWRHQPAGKRKKGWLESLGDLFD